MMLMEGELWLEWEIIGGMPLIPPTPFKCTIHDAEGGETLFGVGGGGGEGGMPLIPAPHPPASPAPFK